MLTSLLVAFALPLVAKADGSDLRDNYVAGTNAGANLETDSTGSSATGNTYVGVAAGYADTTGAANVGLGYGALRAITTGRGNIGLGYMSGQDLTTDTHKLYIQNGFYPAYGVFGSFSSGFFGINNKSPVSAWDVTGAVKADSLNVTGVTSLQGDVTIGGVGYGVATTYAVTSDTTLTAAQTGALWIARLIAAKYTATLPTAVAGQHMQFFVADSDSLLITAATGDSLVAESGTAYKTQSTVAGTVELVCPDAVRWYMVGSTGTWTGY